MIEYHKQYVYQVGYNEQTSNWYNVQSLYRLYNEELIIFKKMYVLQQNKTTLIWCNLNFFLSDGVIT